MARTTIEFTDDASSALEALASRLQTSKTEVLRNALSLYAFVIGEITGDRRLAVVSGTEKKLEELIAIPGFVQKAFHASGAQAAGAD